MAELAAWPDPHEILKLVLAGLGNRIVGPDLYPKFEKDLPVIQVREIGGTSDKLNDSPLVAITNFAATYDECREAAETIRQRLIVPGGHRTAVGNIDRCEVATRPTPMTWPNTELCVRGATYRITTRR